jgi:hypothetical protein
MMNDECGMNDQSNDEAEVPNAAPNWLLFIIHHSAFIIRF